MKSGYFEKHFHHKLKKTTMPANNNDGQKRYERFIELVKAAYVGSLKTENIYKIGQDLWWKVNMILMNISKR